MSSRNDQVEGMERSVVENSSQKANNFLCQVLLPTASFGGHERMLLEWLREADQQGGIDIRIYSRNIPDLTWECAAAGLHVDALAYAIPGQQWRILEIFRDLVVTSQILKRMPGDSIALFAPGVVQTAPWHILVAALCRRRVACYVPMAYGSRDMRFRFATLRDWIVRQVIRHVDTWITITEQQCRLLKDQWRIGAPIYVVPNRLQLPGSVATVRPIPVDVCRPIRVLFLGRFERNQKGLDWLVAELRQHRSSWAGRMHFVFQGQGEYEQALRQLAMENSDDAVSIAPWGDVLQEMQQADVLLLPSRFEGFPLVAVEATHYGVPIVATNQAGLADVLPPESIFPFGDFEAMSKAIERMRDPLARTSAVDYAQTHMSPLLSLDRFEQAVGNITREFAGNAPSTRHTSVAQ